MKFFELKCTTYIKKDVSFQDSFETLAKYISYSMAQDKDMLKLHNKNKFKYYSFSNLYPPQKDKIYHKNNTYSFTIRSLNEKLINNLQASLRENINNSNFLVITADKKVIKQFFITELYSINPVITTIENGKFWTLEQDGDMIKLYNQLHSNLEKKYNEFYNDKLRSNQNFIQLLTIKNLKPQNIWITKNSKSFRFFGNKFSIVPQEDEISQKLAFIALACGLGEKNSFGGGFCLWS
jgi:CRISPR-associated endoribonuclease Cas6